ncbi:MAG TPA: class I SAM-dependent methyltransferase [Longimicrobium sp.]|jgi:SAM-dependent methyltransferase|uniref:class I SAM-dependent methyltransferase n=1 Tax=Longimicrobium sp. TaxID=2029185 RepID=UPI002ED7B783
MHSCPGCGSDAIIAGSSTTATEIARAWSIHGDGTPPPASVVHRSIMEDVGAEVVRFDRCQGCGLEHAVPMRSWSGSNYPRQAYGLAFDHLVALEDLERREPSNLLEIGCANGAFLAAASALGHRPTGIDFVPESVAEARGQGLDVHVGDVRSISRLKPGQRFETIAMFQIIEHLEDPNAVFADIAEVAAPGARIYIGCPSATRYSRHIANAGTLAGTDFWDWPPAHTLRWTDEAFRVFLPRHGWTVRSIGHEPLHTLGAAAHLTAIDGMARGWYTRPVRRRLEIARRLVRVAIRRRLAPRPLTGLRVLVIADLS